MIVSTTIIIKFTKKLSRVRARDGGEKTKPTPNMYKRPVPRPTVCGPVVTPVGTSRVEELRAKVRNMRVPQAPPKVWTPPLDYKFMAKLRPDPEDWIKRCEEWFEAHPSKPWQSTDAPPVINPLPILDVFKKYSNAESGPIVPPVEELEEAWRAAGYSEERIAKAAAHRRKMAATQDERQQIIDAIFAKFPSAYKPGPKLKPKKVIKVVKKKMPQTNNE
jgi:hypothetical protein